MTNYRTEDLSGGWEFKIVRSATGAFGSQQTFVQVVEEEKLGGWELLEKFDNKRIRFRRLISARRDDMMRPQGYDPYRTQIGISQSALGASIAVGFIALSVVIIGIIAITQGGL